MTQYLYEDVKTGERFTLERDMNDEPAKDLTMEGRTLKRVFEGVAVLNREYANGIEKYADGSPIGSRALGRGWPFAKHYDKKNRPLFANKRERDEAHARAIHAGELMSAGDLSKPGRPEKDRMFLDR